MLNLVFRAFGVSVVYLVLGFFFAWLIVNWLAGCGETFITADGSRIAGECIAWHLGALD